MLEELFKTLEHEIHVKRIKYEFGPTKVCSGCKLEKPRSEYYEGATKSGLHYWCKACYCAYDRERREARKKARAA